MTSLPAMVSCLGKAIDRRSRVDMISGTHKPKSRKTLQEETQWKKQTPRYRHRRYGQFVKYVNQRFHRI